MDAKIERFIKHLYSTYPRLQDIVQSFEKCSKYNNGKSFLVSDQTAAVNFDKLTEWICEAGAACKSADSLCYNDSSIFLIEFKSGDQTTHEKKIELLIDGVAGKINDSDDTLTLLYPEDENRLPQRFYLVVDSKKMALNPMIATLTSLSLINNKNEKERIIWETIKPNIKKSIKKPEHYIDIDVWYNELFSTYIQAYNILDVQNPQ